MLDASTEARALLAAYDVLLAHRDRLAVARTCSRTPPRDPRTGR